MLRGCSTVHEGVGGVVVCGACSGEEDIYVVFAEQKNETTWMLK